MDRIPPTLLDEAEVSELECDNYDRIHSDTRYQEEQTVIPNQRHNRTVMCQHVNERDSQTHAPHKNSEFLTILVKTLQRKRVLIPLAVIIFGIGIYCFFF